MKKKKIIFIIFCCISLLMQAQPPSFYHLSTAEGLSDNNITSVARDQNGILWIGTTEGLNNFDGYRITSFHKYQHPLIGENRIDKIIVDDHNRVWFRTASKYLNMLDENRHLNILAVGDSSDKQNVLGIFNTSSKGLVALKGNQHYIWKNKASDKFEKITLFNKNIIPASYRISKKIDRNKMIFYGDNRLVVVDYDSEKVLLNLKITGLIDAININKNELLAYAISGDVFYRISIPQQKIVQEYRNLQDQYGKPIEGNLRYIERINESEFVITSRFSGLYYFNLKNLTVHHWEHDPLDQRTIGGNNTHVPIYDTSGYLFITTLSSGLHYYNTKQKQASSKSYFADKTGNVFDGYIQSVTASPDGAIWMGAQDRLISWDSKRSVASFIPCLLLNGKNISGEETIRSVLWDNKEQLWIATTRFGVLILNKQLKTIAQLTDSMPGNKTSVPSNWVNDICADSKGNLWVATIRGICMVEKDNFKVHDFSSHPVLSKISKISGSVIWIDKKGFVWIGTTSGAWRYNQTNNTLTRYSRENGLAHNNVMAINEDNYGNYYFGTHAGLSVLSAEDGSIKNYNRSNGLRNDKCEGILKDDKGLLWIGNLNCIIRYNPENKKFAVFEEGLGFNHAGFRMRACFKTNSGEMFWGSDKGLIYFFPEQLNNISEPLHPAISALQATDTVFRFTKSGLIRFPYHAASFIFYFSSGELADGRRSQLQYRLSGFDKDWKSPMTSGQATYGKLPPGKYVFQIRASRDGDTWFDAAYPVSLIIGKPWWKQTWFRLLSIITFLGIALFIHSYFQRKRRNKMALMMLNTKIAESKFLNLRLQMNPHFLFNSLSSIQHLIVSQQTTKAYKYLTVFSNFLRSLLNNAEKNFISLEEELKILQMYVDLESLRFDQSFHCEIKTDESLMGEEVLVPSLMVQPFVENAIWHGLLHKDGDKKISIRFSSSSDEFLICEIEDNGIGRKNAAAVQKNKISSMVHESKGIGIIKERLYLLQQKTGKPASLEIKDLYSSNSEPAGTKVIITIPYYNPDES